MSNLSELLPSGGGQNQVEFVASGTLPNGKPVILKTNGQVEAVAETSTSVTESIPLGSETLFNSGATNGVQVAFDPNTAGKFVIVYTDYGNSGAGTAIIGTVSGSNISFGSEAVFNSSECAELSVSFDPNTAGKFVVTYQNKGNSSYGTAIVGTVSGTSISYGSEYVFESAQTSFTSTSFDPNTANKIVISYQDGGNGNKGTAIVGTVSGTSISFGSASVFCTSATSYISISFDPNTANKFIVGGRATSAYAGVYVGTISGTSLSFGSQQNASTVESNYVFMQYDPNTAGKFVVTYENRDNSEYGTAVVGTVSGTSCSFGSTVVFNSGATAHLSLSFDANTANKIVISYQDSGNSNYGTAIVGTVSGTSISFGSESVFNSAASPYTSVSFDQSSAGKFVVAYRDSGASGGGTVTGQIASTVVTTNLTSTNLIGIAAAAASSGATAKINTWGGINEAQSSLTIASDYYVQTDGTITTATGGQKVGQAISATTINMRNQP
jgi:hypothetical protein